jgi:hypothetical protein
MKSLVIWLLVFANAVLLANFLDRVIRPETAQAQNRRTAGDYLLIEGDVAGAATSVIDVLDQTNGQLGAMSYDDSSRKLGVMPTPIDVSAVFQDALNSGQPPVRNPRQH